MKNILNPASLKLKKMNLTQIFFLPLKFARKEEQDPAEKITIDYYSTKKIFQFQPDQALVMKYLKEFQIYRMRNLKNFVN